ncbi:MAG: hypothetical protein J5792_06500, partial [Bacteroidales bacterium]|nr:hypothetical protein [Bacteroidales bacterium]
TVSTIREINAIRETNAIRQTNRITIRPRQPVEIRNGGPTNAFGNRAVLKPKGQCHSLCQSRIATTQRFPLQAVR